MIIRAEDLTDAPTLLSALAQRCEPGSEGWRVLMSARDYLCGPEAENKNIRREIKKPTSIRTNG